MKLVVKIVVKFVLSLALLAIPSISLVTACSSRNLRPHFQNEHTSFGKNGSDLSGHEVLERSWTYSIDPVSSSQGLGPMEYVTPVLTENTLLFGSGRFGLVSLYPKIERPRWKIEIPNGIVSQIEIQGAEAYFTGGDGNVYSIELETGKTLWTYALRNPVSSRPTVDGGELYVVTSDDAVVCLESKTGKWLWHYRRRNISGPTIHGASSPLVVGDAIWVGFADGTLVSLSRKDGKVLWEKRLNTNKRFSNLNASFLKFDHLVYVPAYDNALYALDEKTSAPVWIKDNIGGSKKVSVVDNILYAPTSNGYLYALEAKTGKEIWHFELDSGIASDVVVTPQHVIIGSSSEFLYALERNTGKLVYRFQIGFGSGFSGGLAFDPIRNYLYALSRGGNLLSFTYHPQAKR